MRFSASTLAWLGVFVTAAQGSACGCRCLAGDDARRRGAGTWSPAFGAFLEKNHTFAF